MQKISEYAFLLLLMFLAAVSYGWPFWPNLSAYWNAANFIIILAIIVIGLLKGSSHNLKDQ